MSDGRHRPAGIWKRKGMLQPMSVVGGDDPGPVRVVNHNSTTRRLLGKRGSERQRGGIFRANRLRLEENRLRGQGARHALQPIFQCSSWVCKPNQMRSRFAPTVRFGLDETPENRAISKVTSNQFSVCQKIAKYAPHTCRGRLEVYTPYVNSREQGRPWGRHNNKRPPTPSVMGWPQLLDTSRPQIIFPENNSRLFPSD